MSLPVLFLYEGKHSGISSEGEGRMSDTLQAFKNSKTIVKTDTKKERDRNREKQRESDRQREKERLNI